MFSIQDFSIQPAQKKIILLNSKNFQSHDREKNFRNLRLFTWIFSSFRLNPNLWSNLFVIESWPKEIVAKKVFLKMKNFFSLIFLFSFRSSKSQFAVVFLSMIKLTLTD